MDLALHNEHIAAANKGERTVRFVLVLNERPVPSVNLATLKGYIRLSFMERDGSQSNAAPTNTPTEPDSANCPGEYALELTTAEVTHGEVFMHINDGTGNTFNYQYIPIRLLGGSNNTGGLLHRGL